MTAVATARTTTTLRLGTRASELARTQSQAVADALTAATGTPVELVHIVTEGDRSSAAIAQLGGTGVFVAAIRGRSSRAASTSPSTATRTCPRRRSRDCGSPRCRCARTRATWRVKETDRIAAMAAELRRLGATVVDGDDFIEVEPPAPVGWRRAALRTYDDHRMAMCLSLAAFNPLAGGHVPVRILDPRCVGKTFPDYFETLFGVVATDTSDIPLITIDGPTASGKGTLASTVAARLGWHQLDSGALYRATALAAMRRDVAADDAAGLARVAASLALRFEGDAVSGSTASMSRWHCATRRWASWPPWCRRCPRCARRCTRCSCRFAACRAWWPTGATWARWCSPTRRSRCSSPRAPRCAPSGGLSN